MNFDIFLKRLKHFVQLAKQSVHNNIVLILDGHSSHKGLEMMEYIKANGIIVFCLPAYCARRLQPLHVGLWKKSRKNCDKLLSFSVLLI